MTIKRHVPKLGKDLATYTGRQLVDRLGEETVKKVVTNVLCGSNIRSLTEGLTRRRLALSNSAMLMTFLNASSAIENFSDNLSKLAVDELTETRLTKEEKVYIYWLIGLTGKSVQNVLRGKKADELLDYLKDLDTALDESSEKSREIFGHLEGQITVKNRSTSIDWKMITKIFMAIGTQTLALRGAEKSMYGKLFEKFILGSLLEILGYENINQNNHVKNNKVFWLSERGSKRESDATLLQRPGVGVRFDIGFIGPGNTEISLDKVSRFETEMLHGKQIHFMKTIVIVDRIGDGSRIVEMAKVIKGEIIQMSMALWVRKVASILQKSVGLDHQIITMSDKDTISYIKSAMQKVDLRKFI